MSVKQTVLEILKKYPKTRSSDQELLLMYYSLYWEYSSENFIKYNFQFIRDFIRYRAEIQASWLYPPVEKVKQYRDKKREVKTREFSDYNWRKVKKEFLVDTTKLTEADKIELQKPRKFLPVTEVTGSKVEEKEMKTWFFNWLLQKIWMK